MYFVPRIGKFWYSSQRGYEVQEENLMPRESGLKQFLDWATVILSNNICNENMLYTINYYLRIIQASLDSAFGLFYQAYTLFFWLLSLPQMLPNSRGSFICTSPGLEIHGRLALWLAFAWCRYPIQPQQILIKHCFHCSELNSCELSHSQAYDKLILKAPPILTDRPP